MSSATSSISSSTTSMSPKVNHTRDNEFVTIHEIVNLTKGQNEVLTLICNLYEMTISQYIQQALVEAMQFDIDEGVGCRNEREED